MIGHPDVLLTYQQLVIMEELTCAAIVASTIQSIAEETWNTTGWETLEQLDRPFNEFFDRDSMFPPSQWSTCGNKDEAMAAVYTAQKVGHAASSHSSMMFSWFCHWRGPMTPDRESSGKAFWHSYGGGSRKSGEQYRLIPQDIWPCIGAATAETVRNPPFLSGRVLYIGKACWRPCSKIWKVIPAGFHFSFQRFGEESVQRWSILYICEGSICYAPHQCLLVDVQQNQEGDSDNGKACWRLCSKIKRVILNDGNVEALFTLLGRVQERCRKMKFTYGKKQSLANDLFEYGDSNPVPLHAFTRVACAEGSSSWLFTIFFGQILFSIFFGLRPFYVGALWAVAGSKKSLGYKKEGLGWQRVQKNGLGWQKGLRVQKKWVRAAKEVEVQKKRLEKEGTEKRGRVAKKAKGTEKKPGWINSDEKKEKVKKKCEIRPIQGKSQVGRKKPGWS
ncbi:hypothetical protein C8J57DRAFT_1610286 [Mycena rebaudengoi]|nr:hypothetical protein C8J57DRAFT_1610286 [Mycena rebaudengoi]